MIRIEQQFVNQKMVDEMPIHALCNVDQCNKDLGPPIDEQPWALALGIQWILNFESKFWRL